MKKRRQPYVAPRRIGEPEPGPSPAAFADQLEKLDRVMNVHPQEFEQWRLRALEEATVHLFCAPEDVQLVHQWVARQPSAHLYRVRPNPFVPAGVAYGFQLDGILMPATVSCVMRA
jgi:hypothetical protein